MTDQLKDEIAATVFNILAIGVYVFYAWHGYSGNEVMAVTQ